MDTEELVRASLRAAASDVEPRPAGRAALRATLTRQAARSRRLTVTLSVVAAAAVVAIACVAPVAVHHLGQAPRPAPPGPAAVPWKPLAVTTSPDDLPAACDASRLSARWSARRPESVMGQDNVGVDVTNSGPTCSMPNEDVSLVEAGTGRVLAHPRSARKGDVPIIRSGKTVSYHLSFGTACTDAAAGQPPTTAAALEVDGASLTATGLQLPDALARCADVAFTAPPTARSDRVPYPNLDASIAAPATASGPTLDFTVTLTNDGPEPIDFGSCPSYTEVVTADDGASTTATYQLNCASVPSLAPGGSATFAMRTALPGTTGAARVGWSLANGVPSASATITIG